MSDFAASVAGTTSLKDRTINRIRQEIQELQRAIEAAAAQNGAALAQADAPAVRAASGTDRPDPMEVDEGRPLINFAEFSSSAQIVDEGISQSIVPKKSSPNEDSSLVLYRRTLRAPQEYPR